MSEKVLSVCISILVLHDHKSQLTRRMYLIYSAVASCIILPIPYNFTLCILRDCKLSDLVRSNEKELYM